MSDQSCYIGVDVGGTKILVLVVSQAGEITARFKQPTRHDAGTLAEQIRESIGGALANAGLTDADIAGIGVALPGVVDSDRGVLVTAPNLDVEDNYPLAESLRGHYSAPIAIGNDVNLGTLAECRLGAGVGADTVVGIFPGTGIGGGVVIDGKLRTGREDLAGELGHVVVMVDGPPCFCGNRGCLEAIASRTAIERDIRQGIADGRSTTIITRADGRITSGALAAALAGGDELVTEIMQRVAHYLGQFAIATRHFIDPDMIILGGGVMEACGDFLLPLIQEEVRSDSFRGSENSLQVVASQLGDDAVALGAADLGRVQVTGDAGRVEAANGQQGVPKQRVQYPHIDSVAFGSVVVDGKELDCDICICAKGKLKKRNKKPARKKYGTSHVLDGEELAKICKGKPGMLIIGAGFQHMARLSDDGGKYLEAEGIEYRLLATPEAVEAYNSAAGPKALLLHITC